MIRRRQMKKLLVGVFVILLIFITFNRDGYAEEYNYFGAIVGCSESGEIPAFEGNKDLKCPDNYEKGMFLPNPYAGEKSLYRIDHTNVDKYQHRLSAGQVARLKKNKFYYMNIYPTHRNMEFPEIFVNATLETQKKAYIDADNVLRDFQGGLPFAHPKNGVEAIWNVRKPWGGSDLITHACNRVVSRSGKVRKSIITSMIIAMDKSRLTDPLPNPEGISGLTLSFYIYPADRYGEAILTKGYVDDTKQNDVWQYIPSLRRVRRAPTLTGGMQLDGEFTLDEGGMGFQAKINDWSYELLGRKEIYTTANTYDLWKIGAKDEEECLAGDMNPARVRYELHRCWAIEATANPEIGHPYSKRLLYMDEDHWQLSVSDQYDKRGNLWRTSEYFNHYNYCEMHKEVVGYMYLNLESGRYVLTGGCRDADTLTNQLDVGLKPEQFTVSALRKLGR
jgi:hypothetical protein